MGTKSVSVWALALLSVLATTDALSCLVGDKSSQSFVGCGSGQACFRTELKLNGTVAEVTYTCQAASCSSQSLTGNQQGCAVATTKSGSTTMESTYCCCEFDNCNSQLLTAPRPARVRKCSDRVGTCVTEGGDCFDQGAKCARGLFCKVSSLGATCQAYPSTCVTNSDCVGPEAVPRECDAGKCRRVRIPGQTCGSGDLCKGIGASPETSPPKACPPGRRCHFIPDGSACLHSGQCDIGSSCLSSKCAPMPPQFIELGEACSSSTLPCATGGACLMQAGGSGVCTAKYSQPEGYPIFASDESLCTSGKKSVNNVCLKYSPPLRLGSACSLSTGCPVDPSLTQFTAECDCLQASSATGICTFGPVMEGVVASGCNSIKAEYQACTESVECRRHGLLADGSICQDCCGLWNEWISCMEQVPLYPDGPLWKLDCDTSGCLLSSDGDRLTIFPSLLSLAILLAGFLAR